MTECRRRCSGGPFDHAPTIMSIARSSEERLRLRCPICQQEVVLQPGVDGLTPTPKDDRPPILPADD